MDKEQVSTVSKEQVSVANKARVSTADAVQASTTKEAQISPLDAQRALNPRTAEAIGRRHSLPAGPPTEVSDSSHLQKEAVPSLIRQKSDGQQDPTHRAALGPALIPTSNPPGPQTASRIPPRIVNPATRGRKAALKSDAAGQVPQHILPPVDPIVVQTRVVVLQQDGTMLPVAEAPPAAPQPAKRKMRFPGFQSANQQGGPWSREAGDLLDVGPVGGP